MQNHCGKIQRPDIWPDNKTNEKPSYILKKMSKLALEETTKPKGNQSISPAGNENGALAKSVGVALA